ncbi:M36 family metallopeptidase [Noviluteimonas gilva]|uniref:Peptidase M36 n=1 Tax=Noviluteimonas gilva TaxID=2682097 RepID=A0A7C9HMH1_9GAMM|nr:M36 family metallopeptidase [Lysobacter gilvus]MUV14515.1 peptidase M36 [Lysobacter gilvus]
MKILASTCAVGLLSAAVALAVQAAAAVPTARDDRAATRINRAGNGQALTAPSQAAPSTVVSTFLRGKGLGSGAVNALRVHSDTLDRKGIRQLRMQQEVGGLAVYGAYVKAAVGRNGALLSVVENVAPVPATGLQAAKVDETAALRVALGARKIAGAAPARVQKIGAATKFAKTAGFHDGPIVTRVAVPLADGGMQVGFLVETWREAGNDLVETLVSGDGRVLDTSHRTARDDYRVFTVDPIATPQAIVSGPTNWLFNGSHLSDNITGNNVHAYLDTDNNGLPDAGGTRVSDRRFLSTFNPAVQPSVGNNPDVAVQNLFYLNNVIHDRLYAAGFDEAAGNFQQNNFGLGGRGNDSVNAEAQDGGSTDNANFATPRDGRNPRMQMYLWSSPEPDHQVIAGGNTFQARRAEFSPPFTPTGLQDTVVAALDSGGTSNADGCEALTTNVSGQIALVNRGTCDFVVKAANAQAAGAVALIVANNVAGDPIVMGGTTPQIPAVMVTQAAGATLRAASPIAATIRVIDPPLIRRDGDLDSDIVWHEYGHGLTWRMIGRMDGPLGGAIGEGMSDVLAIIVNNNDRVAEYSTGTPNGLRTEPYANYSRTYGDILGEEVHFDGEVYGAIGWQVWKNFQAAGFTADQTLAVLVDGMNYTPAEPTFEEMRDGILASLTNVGQECLVWRAFAQYGVGVGARGQARGKKVAIRESFAVPAVCAAP